MRHPPAPQRAIEIARTEAVDAHPGGDRFGNGEGAAVQCGREWPSRSHDPSLAPGRAGGRRAPAPRGRRLHDTAVEDHSGRVATRSGVPGTDECPELVLDSSGRDVAPGL